jgi:hypothetical protein
MVRASGLAGFRADRVLTWLRGNQYEYISKLIEDCGIAGDPAALRVSSVEKDSTELTAH